MFKPGRMRYNVGRMNVIPDECHVLSLFATFLATFLAITLLLRSPLHHIWVFLLLFPLLIRCFPVPGKGKLSLFVFEEILHSRARYDCPQFNDLLITHSVLSLMHCCLLAMRLFCFSDIPLVSFAFTSAEMTNRDE